MSNIDKDIELVSNLKNVELKGKVNEQYIYTKIPEEYLNAIENVLEDREMWKKTAYKLAEKVEKFDKNVDVCDNIPLAECPLECLECIIDIARKEVKNEEV